MTRPATAWWPGNASPQAAPDALLGWARYRSGDEPTIDFYVRQMWDGKLSAEVETMAPDDFGRYVTTCASALALAHARSGDASMINGYLGDDDSLGHQFEGEPECFAHVGDR